MRFEPRGNAVHSSGPLSAEMVIMMNSLSNVFYLKIFNIHYSVSTMSSVIFDDYKIYATRILITLVQIYSNLCIFI